MKLLFTACFMLISAFTVFAQSPVDVQVAEWERAKAYTKAYLDVMPADGYALKPTPEMRTFAQQMGHLADANQAFASAASGIKNPATGSIEKGADQSKEAITKGVMDSYDFVISSLKSVSPENFGKPVKVFGKEMSAQMAFAKAFEHQTHHRGQATVYIRLKGVTPPQEMLF